jgi:predicted CXXCH cytochrome family protein
LPYRALLAVLLAGTLAAGGEAVQPLNADPAVAYIGSQNCAACHGDERRSYLETTHSRSMEKVDLTGEVAGVSFRHEASGNDYQILPRDDGLYHREVIRGADGTALATTEHRMVYTMGSGAHGKSYIYQSGSFFGQSPLSWYEETRQWGMSPGYDLAFHPGFARKLSAECFFCHVGNIDRKAGNPNDFSILETTVGCERCHGPGELHAAKHRSREELTGVDPTTVNPARLPRTLSEAICQQCHLQAAGKAMISGRDEWDYRPGLPLTDFRLDFQYRLGDDTMRVVGHVEQLHMSECYKQSESLTCITCHDPHHSPPPEAIVEHYRTICLECHSDDACGEPRQARDAVAGNDCSTCHMPKQGSEVPHTAFSHHRIGIHRDVQPNTKVIAGLTPVLDVSRLPADELVRCEALAKFQVSQEQPDEPSFREYGVDAAKALIQLKNAGRADADVNAILAMLASLQGQPEIARQLASEVVEGAASPSRAKIESLRLLAQLAYQRKDFTAAARHYRELTQYREESHDFFQLGLAEQNSGDSQRAIGALRKSVELGPASPDAHRILSAILKLTGQTDPAARHAELARQHELRLQRLWDDAQR